MIRVGLVGGLGPESTIDYYRRLLSACREAGFEGSPPIVIDSLDAALALRMIETDRPALVHYLLGSLERLAGARADFAVITANTAHIVFDEVEAHSPLPLVSIVETCAEEARGRDLQRLALLGTRFTMEGSFYPDVFARYGVSVVSPGPADRARLHDVYLNQLLKGAFLAETREEVCALVERIRRAEQIDGVILGGTELPILLRTDMIGTVPLLDTTALHVAAIVRRLVGAGVNGQASRRG
jgi:aspartate racemase